MTTHTKAEGQLIRVTPVGVGVVGLNKVKKERVEEEASL